MNENITNFSDAEKLERFSIAVNEKIDAQIDEILSEAETEKDNIIKSAKEQAEIEAEEKINSALSEINVKYKRKKSQVQQESKKELLLHREKLTKQIYDNVKKKIVEFTSSSEYVSYLCKLLEGEDISGNKIIRMRQQDFKLKEDIQKALNLACEFEVDDNIEYGGVAIYDTKSHVINDKTIDNAFEEQKNQCCLRYSFLDC